VQCKTGSAGLCWGCRQDSSSHIVACRTGSPEPMLGSCAAGNKLPYNCMPHACLEDMHWWPVLGFTCCRTRQLPRRCAWGWHYMPVLGCCAAGNKLPYSCSMTGSTDPCWGQTLKLPYISTACGMQDWQCRPVLGSCAAGEKPSTHLHARLAVRLCWGYALQDKLAYNCMPCLRTGST
jgi:hypothetical protein